MRLVFAALSSLLLAPAAQAFNDTADFPYEATVGSDNVIVRSGPGGRYYPTGRLSSGDRVIVHRHDPGGWFMVSPPQGSFSWIPAEGVQVAGTTGTITASSVAVRVGSRFDETDQDVVSRQLSRDETVQVIGRGQDKTGKPLLKIAPPRLEYRWVSGGVLAPVSRKKPNQPITKSRTATGNRQVSRSTIQVPDNAGKTSGSKIAYESTPINKPAYQALEDLDKTFGKIAGGPPAGWSFKKLETDYRQLMESTRIPGFRTLIRRRLAAINRYRQRQLTLKEIQALAESTNRRDAAIRQAGLQVTKNTNPQPTTPSRSKPTTQPTTTQQTTQPTPTPRLSPQFTGAGIVRPIATNHPKLPSFVLVAPDGRLLAFLQPAAGISLAGWVNRSVGVTGPRGFNRDLQADLLQIRSIHPVRLRR
ncbi:MAG: hypothetical protein CMJ69_21305 [Planctomycetaceae bacterium]|nr:hypothetical protein [Planctomycetaceae bacterium]